MDIGQATKQTLKSELDSYVDAGHSTAADWINRCDVEMQRIRHKYFHFSANYHGIGMDPELGNNGRRTRIIQDG